MPRTLKDVLDESNPNKLPSGGQVVKLGSALALLPRFIFGAVVANVLALANDVKARFGLIAFASVGGSTGVKTFVAGAPAAGQFSIDAKGDIIFAAADAVTQAEVSYIAAEGEVITEDIDVVGSVATLPSGRNGILLIRAEVLTGIILGVKTIAARGTAPAAGNAAIQTTGLGVAFNAADVVAGKARLTYVVEPGTGGTTSVASRLAANASF